MSVLAPAVQRSTLGLHTLEQYEPLIGASAEVLTPQVIYYASDYPHWDNEFPENIEHLGRRKDLDDEEKKWLFAESAKKLYNLS